MLSNAYATAARQIPAIMLRDRVRDGASNFAMFENLSEQAGGRLAEESIAEQSRTKPTLMTVHLQRHMQDIF
jgi:hypothetical protein